VLLYPNPAQLTDADAAVWRSYVASVMNSTQTDILVSLDQVISAKPADPAHPQS
jgi:hypothetical protein